MGHKVNPNTFRTYLSKRYLSNWYAEKLQYSKYLQQDFFIRKIIENLFNKYTIVATIKINRINNKFSFKNSICINISSLIFETKKIFNTIFFNSQLGGKYYSYIQNFVKYKGIKVIDDILENLFILKFFKNMSIQFTKMFQQKFSTKIKIKYTFINDFFDDLHLMALYICIQVKKKINCKRIMSTLVENLPSNILGIRIEICGRHTGAQRATKDKITFGRIQLNSLNCDLDYVQKENKTRDGAFGVKLWIYKAAQF